ncbi:MAG: hypothetical protein NC033_04825 [Clostridiales bacterium]|nr:hypothetical protein [Clostridiales bacterium]
MKILLDNGTTEFIIEDKGKDGFHIAIYNRYINYESIGYLFCYGDIEYITESLKKFINGELKVVAAAGTTELDLNIIFCPKGAKAIREAGEDIAPHYTIVDRQKQVLEEHYKCNFIIIEVHLYSGQHWVASLTEEESNDFCKQWLEEF